MSFVDNKNAMFEFVFIRLIVDNKVIIAIRGVILANINIFIIVFFEFVEELFHSFKPDIVSQSFRYN